MVNAHMRTLRLRHRFSYRTLGTLIDQHWTRLFDIEHGARASTYEKQLIAAALQVPVCEVFPPDQAGHDVPTASAACSA